MSIFSVDIEADGPCPGLYSMVQLGAIKVEPTLQTTFVRDMKAMTDIWVPGALNSIGMTREQTLAFSDPKQAMIDFKEFVESNTTNRAVMVSDNPAFDWQFVNYYFIYFLGLNSNPFGHSARRLGDYYAGLVKDWRGGGKFRKFRKTAHTHNALDDAKGNAEALLAVNAQHRITVDYR